MQRVSVRLEKSGRILIPAQIRRQLALKEGESEVVLEIEQDKPIAVSTRAQAIRKAQALMAQYAPQYVGPGRTKSMSEELIAERRAEARAYEAGAETKNPGKS
jgi:AbrB family looped-hinge helix DNA binding protein